VQYIQVNGKINKDVAKENKYGLMEASMKEIGPMIRHVERAN
jgi:hypothetical protein